MTVLVTAATKTGATAEIADVIAATLREHGISAEVVPPDDVHDVSRYGAVVLGSAVYGGRWLPAASALVDRCSSAWPGRPVWLFSSGPVGDPRRPLVQKMGSDPLDLPRVRATTGAREHRMFGGRMLRQDQGILQRVALRLFRDMEGDFRDWDAVRAWATGIAEALRSARTGGPAA